jgi:diacylglycerol kinase family enzyme
MLLPGMNSGLILKNLEQAQARGFDIGHVNYDNGQTFFLEGAGIGILGNILASYNPEMGKSIWRALRASVDTLSTFEAETIDVTIDGQVVRSCMLMLEIMNTDALGYRFKLAKYANCSDGLLDVLIVHKSLETNLLGHVARVIDQSFEDLSNVEVIQGKQICIKLPEWEFHADAEVISIPNSHVTIEVEPQALTFLVAESSSISSEDDDL